MGPYRCFLCDVSATGLAFLGCWLFFALLAGCVVFPPEQRPELPLELPQAYSLDVQGTQELSKWWTAFDSQELNALVSQALEGNFDIRIAWSRLRQARAQARKAGSDLLPQFQGESGLERSQTWKDGSILSQKDKGRFALAASYEIDLWGRIRSGRQAELLSSQSARLDLETAALSVAGEVAAAWVGLLAARQEADLVQEQIATNTTLLDLQLNRFANGLAGALAISQQEEALAASKSDLPGLEAEAELQLNSLTLLLGLADRQKLKLSQRELPQRIPLPETGLPVQLIDSRPDIQAAWVRLQSADWEVSEAKAERLPSLRLTAQGSLSGSSLDQILGNWLSNLAAGLSAPLFQGGRLAAEVERTQAAAEEQALIYGRTVAQAIQEVQDALFREFYRTRTMIRLEEQLQAALRAQKQAKISYFQGQSSYLDFLIQLKNVQALQRQLLKTRAQLLRDRIALYRTLGTGWTAALTQEQNMDHNNDPA